MIAASLYKIIVGIILGIAQGISEWLPISSKTQIILISSFLLKLNFSNAYTLGLFLEGGTFIAAVIYFRKEIYKALLSLVGKGDKEGKLLLKYIVIVTLVTAVIAIPIYKFVSATVTGPVIGIPMIVLGILLLVDWALIKFSKSKKSARKELHNLSIMDMVFVGIAQGISALPGISRSGATVSTMLFVDTKPEEAFRLSFFALIPASLGATLVTILFTHPAVSYVVSVITVPGLIASVIVSTVISLIFIKWLIKSARTSRIENLIMILAIIAIASGIIAVLAGVG